MNSAGFLGLSLAIGVAFASQSAYAVNVAGWCPDGQRAFDAGNFEVANLALNSCLHSPPEDQVVAADGYFLRGLIYAERRDYQAALGDLDRAVELAPENADAWRNKAWVHYKLNELHPAVTSIERALELDTQSTASHHIHAQILTAMERDSAAMDAYDLAYSFESRATVQQLQEALVSQDYDIGSIDGVYGGRTRDALKACIADGCSLLLQ